MPLRFTDLKQMEDINGVSCCGYECVVNKKHNREHLVGVRTLFIYSIKLLFYAVLSGETNAAFQTQLEVGNSAVKCPTSDLNESRHVRCDYFITFHVTVPIMAKTKTVESARCTFNTADS